MKFLELEQGTPEWLTWRAGKLTASVAAAVMDEGKWFPKNRKDLAELLSGRRSTEQNAAMAHGTNMEPIAREAASEALLYDFQPICVEDGRYAASLDGWDATTNKALLEVKCPISGTDGEIWKTVERGGIPPHYYWQMVQQIALSDAKIAIFFVYVDGEYLLQEVDVESAKVYWEQDLKPAWEDFWGRWDPDTPWNENESLEAQLAASLYVNAKRQLDSAYDRGWRIRHLV
jgi:putative phage-type endonuclease